MDGRDGVDVRELVQRFEAGDRSPDLLNQLNQAAFECFHAPWETPPCPGQADDLPPGIKQGLLPMNDEESEEGPEEPAMLSIPERIRLNPTSPSAPGQHSDPLDALVMALDMMGLRAYLAPGHSLVLSLLFDPKADNQSWIAFRAHQESQTLQMVGYGDLALGGSSEQALEGLCRAYNRRNTGLQAKITHPQEGARARLRLTTSIPFELTHSFLALAEHLGEVFQKERQFWRYVRRSLPI